MARQWGTPWHMDAIGTPAAPRLDGVTIDGRTQDSLLKIQREVRTNAEEWGKIAEDAERVTTDRRPSFRGAALAEFRRPATTHIFVDAADRGAGDFRSNANRWRVRQVGRSEAAACLSWRNHACLLPGSRRRPIVHDGADW